MDEGRARGAAQVPGTHSRGRVAGYVPEAGNDPLDPDPPAPSIRRGIVDVHQRAMWLRHNEQLSEADALRQAIAEVQKYGQHARCDRCAVVRPALHLCESLGRCLAVCGYCR